MGTLQIFFIGLLSVIMAFFQNCAQGGFEASRFGNGTASLSSTSEPTGDQLLKVEGVSFPTGGTPVIQVFADLGLVKNVKSVLWDNSFKNDSTYCDQTTAVSRVRTDFLCPGAGKLTIFLIVTFNDGSQKTYSRELQVDSHLIPDDPTPPPGPPASINGATLYTTNCSGCHGALAVSAKRGINLSRLNSALSSVGTMTSLAGSLSSEQRQAIVNALQ